MQKVQAKVLQDLAFSPIVWITFVALNVSYIFTTRVERPLIEWRLTLQNQIIDGTAPEPFRFRILVPWLAQTVQQVFSNITTTEWAHILTFFGLNTFFLWVVLWNIWTFNDNLQVPSKIIAILVFGFAANIGLFDHFYQPWTLLEAAIVSTAFRQAVAGRFAWLPVLGIVGTLNRDTGVLLPVLIFLFLALRGRLDIKSIVLTFGSILLSVATFLALRIVIGPADQVTLLEEILATNLSSVGLLKLAVNLALMFGVGWYFASWKGQESIYRVIWMSFTPYFALILVFGIWLEVRLLLPLVWVLAIQIGESFERLGKERMGSAKQFSGDERI